MKSKKILRISTVPSSLDLLLTDQMKFMTNQGYKVIMISASGREVKNLIKREGCQHIEIPFTRKITLFKDLYCLWLLIKVILQTKPEIVHTHSPKAGLLGMIASFICRVPLRFHTIAGLPLMVHTGLKRKVLNTTEKITYFCATKVLPNSKSIMEFVIEQRFTSKEKLEMIGYGSSNGIDLSRFSPSKLQIELLDSIKKKVLYDPNSIYFLSVGRIVKDKGIEELVSVFKKLNTEYQNTKLIILGEYEKDLDPIQPEIEFEIENNPNIIFIGWSDHVEYYMSFCHSLIHGSYREGFPNVLLQAGAMKCPIICSHIPGNIDIVDDSETGLIFRVKDKDALYAKMVWSLKNVEKIHLYSQDLYEKIHTYFERKKFHELIKEFYLNQNN